MKINKNELKQSAVATIQSWQFSEKQSRRIESIVRACINHLSYDLTTTIVDNKTAICLRKGDRIIVIERNPDMVKGPDTLFSRNPLQYFRVAEHAYRSSVRLITEIKGNLEKKAAEHDSKTVCAD